MSSSLSTKDKLELVTIGYIRKNIEYKYKQVTIPKAVKLLISSFVPNLWIDSKILTSKERDMLLSMVENHEITKKFTGCEWKLIFRASRDGYFTNQFHDKCDGKENTVCFVETEHGHVAGGYIELAWSDGKGTGYRKQCKNVYMFVIRPTQEIFEQIISARPSAVAHYWGDAFNFGYNDLYLKNGQYGYCAVAGHFDFKSTEQITGSSKRAFQYKDYEVFQLMEYQ